MQTSVFEIRPFTTKSTDMSHGVYSGLICVTQQKVVNTLWNLKNAQKSLMKIVLMKWQSGVQGRLKISRWKSWFLLQLSLLGMPEHKSFHFDFFLSVFDLNTSDDELVPPPLHRLSLPPRRCPLVSDVICCFLCSIKYMELLAVFIFYSSWALLFRLMISVAFAFDSFESKRWKHISFTFFCPEHAFFAPHQSCHLPPFFNTPPLNVYPYWLMGNMVLGYCSNAARKERKRNISSAVVPSLIFWRS